MINDFRAEVSSQQHLQRLFTIFLGRVQKKSTLEISLFRLFFFFSVFRVTFESLRKKFMEVNRAR